MSLATWGEVQAHHDMFLTLARQHGRACAPCREYAEQFDAFVATGGYGSVPVRECGRGAQLNTWLVASTAQKPAQ